MDIRIANEIPMSAQGLWQIMHTPQFDAFTAREYELKEYTEIERSVAETLTRRRVRIVTGTDLSYIPWGLAHKILHGNRVVYEETQYKYNHRYEMRWSGKWIEPRLFKKKVRVSGTVRLIPIDDGRCKRIREMSIPTASIYSWILQHVDIIKVIP